MPFSTNKTSLLAITGVCHEHTELRNTFSRALNGLDGSLYHVSCKYSVLLGQTNHENVKYENLLAPSSGAEGKQQEKYCHEAEELKSSFFPLLSGYL